MSDFVKQFKAAVLNTQITYLEERIWLYPDSQERYNKILRGATYSNSFEQFDQGPFPTEDGEFVLVHEVGGSEGDGEYVQHVFELNGRFIEVTGTYTSWGGTDWDYGHVGEVEPREVSRIEYS